MQSVRTRLRSSLIRDAYWAVGHRDRLESLQQEVGFYQQLLAGFGRGNVIFDIGANEGDKTDIFLRLGARVIAVEPDDACSRNLNERFLDFRLRPRPVSIVNKAVSDRVGVEEMLIDGPGSAVNTMSSKWAESLRNNRANFEHGHCGLEFSRTRSVQTTTVQELIAQHGAPFFIKIDVEGHELSVLRGLKQPVPYLSFEVNLPEFRAEGVACVQLLSQLKSAGQFNYMVDCAGGLVLKSWVSAKEMSAVLEQCGERSVEIFWKTRAV